jgi:hypothetical protein
MGAMVLKAITIAQRTQVALENQVTLSMTTHTVTLVDDIIPHDMVRNLTLSVALDSCTFFFVLVVVVG